jgi:hypothetical protein
MLLTAALVPAEFAVVSTHQPALAYNPFSLCIIHKEGLCPSSGDINRLMMMVIQIKSNGVSKVRATLDWERWAAMRGVLESVCIVSRYLEPS